MPKKSVILLLIAVAVLVSLPAGVAHADSCSPQSTYEGTCTVTGTVTPDDVTLTGSETPRTGTPSTPPASDPTEFDDCDNPSSTTCVRPFIATVTAPVRLSDIASFRPTPPVDHGEPNGWAVIDLDTNFFATGSTHVKSGVLLGRPAEVRFTPVRWHWSYGDGTAASHPYPGASWASQRRAEFDPTGTSHVYRRPGTYVIDLDVDFAAEYRYAGGPWVDIAGELTVAANRLVIRAGDATTVLVERDCARHPRGPGC